MRVPLENGCITLSRAGRNTIYPANFQLLMATNPCPCGNYGSKTKICLCSARAIEQYWKKISAPLLDRIDLRVPVENENENCEEKKSENDERKGFNSTEEIRKKIAKAVKMQKKRQSVKNAKLSPQEIEKFCKLNEECSELLKKAVERYGFSPRAIASCLKVARTIADMEEKESILPIHLAEAIDYRKLCSNIVPEI